MEAAAQAREERRFIEREGVEVELAAALGRRPARARPRRRLARRSRRPGGGCDRTPAGDGVQPSVLLGVGDHLSVLPDSADAYSEKR
mgnify:CR=1 FL=1